MEKRSRQWDEFQKLTSEISKNYKTQTLKILIDNSCLTAKKIWQIIIIFTKNLTNFTEPARKRIDVISMADIN